MDRIKVGVKVRPLIQREKANNCDVHWQAVSESCVSQIDPATGGPKGEPIAFDHVFGPDSSNREVFEVLVKPIVESAVRGFNGTIFAYGQTASGKTYTMMGDQFEPGIIPQAVNLIFNTIEHCHGREFLLRVCYMEIYNEKVHDLLCKSNRNLKISEDNSGNVFVKDLQETITSSSQMVMDLMKRGEQIRKIGVTNMNERSSRSHSIFRVIIESRATDSETDEAIQVSHLNLVDLAGSERAGATGAVGDRFLEGCAINKSLFTLGKVISQLSEGQSSYVNFRDSKLTRILQSSLGGNALTAIVCAITPAALDETSSTLGFASRARNIQNTAQVNEVLTERALLKRYMKQINLLKTEISSLEEAKSAENQHLQNQNVLLQERLSRLKDALLVSNPDESDQSEKSREKLKKLRRRTWSAPNRKVTRLSLGFPINNKKTESFSALNNISEEDSRLSMLSMKSDLDESMFVTPLEEFEKALMKAESEKSLDWLPSTDLLEEETRKSIEGDFENTPAVNYVQTRRNRGHLSRLDEDFVPETPPSKLRATIRDKEKELEEIIEFTKLEKQMFDEELMEENATLRSELRKVKSELQECRAECESLHDIKNHLENLKLSDKNTHDLQVLLLDTTKELSKLNDEKKELAEKLSVAEAQCIDFDKMKAELDLIKKELADSRKEKLLFKSSVANQEEQMRLLQNEKDDFDFQFEIMRGNYEKRLKDLTQALEDARHENNTPQHVVRHNDHGGLYSLAEEPSIDELVQQLELLKNENKDLINKANDRSLLLEEVSLKQDKIRDLEEQLSVMSQSLSEMTTSSDVHVDPMQYINEIESLKNANDVLKEELANKEEVLLLSSNELESLKNQLNDLRNAASKPLLASELDINRVQKSCDEQASEQLLHYENEVSVLKSEKEALKLELESKLAVIEESQKELEQVRSQAQDLLKTLQGMTEESSCQKCIVFSNELASSQKLLSSELRDTELSEKTSIPDLANRILVLFNRSNEECAERKREVQNETQLRMSMQEELGSLQKRCESLQNEMCSAQKTLLAEVKAISNNGNIEELSLSSLVSEFLTSVMAAQQHVASILQLKIENCTNELEATTQRELDCQKVIEELRCEVKHYNDKNESLKQALEDLKQEQHDTLDLENILNKLKTLVDASDTVSYDELASIIENRLVTLLSKSEELDHLQSDTEQQLSEIDILKSSITDLEKQVFEQKEMILILEQSASDAKHTMMLNEENSEKLREETSSERSLVKDLQMEIIQKEELVEKLERQISELQVKQVHSIEDEPVHDLKQNITDEEQHSEMDAKLKQLLDDLSKSEWRCDELIEENTSLKSSITVLENQVSEFRETVLGLEQSASEAKQALMEIEENSEKLKESCSDGLQITELKQEISHKEELVEKLEKDLSELQQKFDAVSVENELISDLRASVTVKEEKLHELESNLQQLSDNLMKGEERSEILTEENAGLKSRISALENQVSEYKEMVLGLEQSDSEAKQALMMIEENSEKLKESCSDGLQITELKQEISHKEELVEKLEKDLSELQQKFDAVSVENELISDLRASVTVKEEKLHELESNLQQLSDNLMKGEERSEILTEENAGLKSRISALENQISEFRETVLGLEQSASEAKQALMMIEENSEKLKEESSSDRSQVTQLKQEITHKEELVEKLEKDLSDLQQKLDTVSVENELISELRTSVTVKEEKLHELESNLQQLSDNLMKGEERSEILTEENAGLKSRISALENQVSEYKEMVLGLEQSASEAKQALMVIKENSEKLKEESSSDRLQVTELKQEISHKGELVEKLEKDLSDLQQKLDAVSVENELISELRTSVTVKEEKLHELESNLQQLSDNLMKGEERSEILTEENAGLKSRISALENQVSEYKEMVLGLEQSASETKQALMVIKENSEKLKEEVLNERAQTAELQREIVKKQELVEKLEGQFLELQQRLDDKVAEIVLVETNVTSKEEELHQTEVKLSEERGLVDSLRNELMCKNSLLEEQEEKLSDLQQKLQAQIKLLAGKDLLHTKATSMYNELSEMKDRVSKLQSDLSSKTSSLEEKEHQIDSLQKCVEDLEKHKSTLQSDLLKSKAEKDLALKNLALKSSVTPTEAVQELKAENEFLKQQHEEVLKGSRDMRTRNRKLQAEINKLKEEINVVKETIDEPKKSTSGADLEILHGQLKEEISKREELENQLDQICKLERSTKTSRVSDLRQKRASLDIKHSKEEIENLKGKEEKYKLELATKSQDLTNLNRILEEKEKTIACLESKLQDCQECRNKLEQISDLEKEKSDLDKECEELLSWGRSHESNYNELVDRLAEVLKDLAETKLRLTKVAIGKVQLLSNLCKEMVSSLDKVTAEQVEMQLSSKEKATSNANGRLAEFDVQIQQASNNVGLLENLCNNLKKECDAVLSLDDESVGMWKKIESRRKPSSKHCSECSLLSKWGKEKEAKAIELQNIVRDLSERLEQEQKMKPISTRCSRKKLVEGEDEMSKPQCSECVQMNEIIKTQKSEIADSKAEIVHLKLSQQLQNKPTEETIKRLEGQVTRFKDEIKCLKAEMRRTVKNHETTVREPHRRASKVNMATQTTESSSEIYRSLYWSGAPSGIVEESNKALLESRCKKLEQEKEAYKNICVKRKERIEYLEEERSKYLNKENQENDEPNKSTYFTRSRKNN